jgi:Ulp1 family protease
MFSNNLIDLWMSWISVRESSASTNCFIFTGLFYPELVKKGANETLNWAEEQNVDVFSVRYILFPIHISNHWSLAIVVNPGILVKEDGIDKVLLQNMRSAINMKSQNADTSKPAMSFIHLDSLPGIHKSKKIATKLQEWLERELVKKIVLKGSSKETAMQQSKNIFPQLMPLIIPQVPSQPQGNKRDSGVFVSHFALGIFRQRMDDIIIKDIIGGNSLLKEKIAKSFDLKFDITTINLFRASMDKVLNSLAVEYAKLDPSESKKGRMGR